MNNFQSYFDDEYNDYESTFDAMSNDRQARRKRKPKVNHQPKKKDSEIIEEIADTTGLEGGFETTYKPSKHEAAWLLKSLRPFYDLNLITDVLAQVKGGKEANVYRCQAHPNTGFDLVAAKVYRPRMFRQLRNDSAYRAGREVLTEDGRPVGKQVLRVERAMTKKSSYGELVRHTSWLMYEFNTLKQLQSLWLPVPKAIQSAENALLMGYIGDEYSAAPTLSQVNLDPDEAAELRDKVLHYIEVMLQNDIVHGDLSAYNILYWQGNITLIDFPQVVNPHSNDHGRHIFTRDVTRVCDYFAAQGAPTNAEAFADKLWNRYCAIATENRLADESRLMPDPDDDEE